MSAVMGTIVQPVQGQPTFGPTLNLSSNSGGSYAPKIAVSGSNIYVLWRDDTPGNPEVFFRRSTDNGVTFDAVINLSNNTGESFLFQSIVASGSNVYVVWYDDTLGNYDVLFRRSADGGATFESVVNLSNNPGNSIYLGVAASGSNVYVAWVDNSLGNYERFFRRSTDSGATFGDVANLSNTPGTTNAGDIAVSGSNMYVSWSDDTSGNLESFFKRSTDNGVNFDPAINLSNNPGYSFGALIRVSGTNVYALWADNTPGSLDWFFRRSIDSGASFGPVIDLSNARSGVGIGLGFAASGSNVYVVWDNSGPASSAIFYRRSTDNGATFTKTTKLSGGSPNSYAPSIAVSGSNVYVAFGNNVVGGTGEIFFRASSDNGATFGNTLNLSNNSGSSYAPPALAASGTNVYVAWYDGTPGNFEILFRAGQ